MKKFFHLHASGLIQIIVGGVVTTLLHEPQIGIPLIVSGAGSMGTKELTKPKVDTSSEQ